MDSQEHQVAQVQQHKRTIKLNKDTAKRAPQKSNFQTKKLTGHDVLLEQYKKEACPVWLHLTTSDESAGGRIYDYDKFTITLKFDDGVLVVYYKHAVESFRKA